MITPLASYELLPSPTLWMTRKLESTGLKGRPDIAVLDATFKA